MASILDTIGDLAAVRKELGTAGADAAVVIQLPNGERFEVQSGGWSIGGQSSFLTSAGKLSTSPHAILTIRQAKAPANPSIPQSRVAELMKIQIALDIVKSLPRTAVEDELLWRMEETITQWRKYNHE